MRRPDEDGLNVRSTFRFNARMTPMRAIIVGPPSVATRIKASIAVCHSAASCSAFGSRVMNFPAARTKLRLVPVQAGPDAVDVRNLGAAQAKRVACTRLSPFGRVGLCCHRQHQDRKRRCQHQTELEIPGPDGKHGDRSPQAFIRELWVKDRGLARCRRPPRQRPRHQ
jgi:hypothetical protein